MTDTLKELLTALVNVGIRPTWKQNDLDNHLWHAAWDGDTGAVQRLLAKGADVHFMNDWALRRAAEHGHTEVVKVLLAAGANVHADNVFGHTDVALRLAAYHDHTETVKVLLAAGADVHAKNDEALCEAAYDGHTEMLKILARHIFAPNSWRGKSQTEIEAEAKALYDKIESHRRPVDFCPSEPIKPEQLRKARGILFDIAIDCWHQVQPPPPQQQEEQDLQSALAKLSPAERAALAARPQVLKPPASPNPI